MDFETLRNELMALSIELRSDAEDKIYAESEEEFAEASGRAQKAEQVANALDRLLAASAPRKMTSEEYLAESAKTDEAYLDAPCLVHKIPRRSCGCFE